MDRRRRGERSRLGRRLCRGWSTPSPSRSPTRPPPRYRPACGGGCRPAAVAKALRTVTYAPLRCLIGANTWPRGRAGSNSKSARARVPRADPPPDHRPSGPRVADCIWEAGPDPAARSPLAKEGGRGTASPLPHRRARPTGESQQNWRGPSRLCSHGGGKGGVHCGEVR